ncbi:hypothetical protein [Microbacterium murale]|uniref:hypothetical protein n=1 Tax=Microbacterium murale TaxID=1081040 RepID=UPI0027D82F7C|nr:hypothetical protein [Microbacterium murale]
MNELLHIGALGAAAVGAGALCTTRRATGRLEKAAALLMLVGMADAMTVSLLAPVAWFALMVTAGIALAVARRRMPLTAAAQATSGPVPLSAHLALGLVVTATLILLMPTTTSAELLVAATHSHGSAGSMSVFVCVAVGLGSVAFAATAFHSHRSWRHRLHHVAMATSTVAMSAVILS